jgi:hypothetical protein
MSGITTTVISITRKVDPKTKVAYDEFLCKDSQGRIFTRIFEDKPLQGLYSDEKMRASKAAAEQAARQAVPTYTPQHKKDVAEVIAKKAAEFFYKLKSGQVGAFICEFFKDNKRYQFSIINGPQNATPSVTLPYSLEQKYADVISEGSSKFENLTQTYPFSLNGYTIEIPLFMIGMEHDIRSSLADEAVHLGHSIENSQAQNPPASESTPLRAQSNPTQSRSIWERIFSIFCCCFGRRK